MRPLVLIAAALAGLTVAGAGLFGNRLGAVSGDATLGAGDVPAAVGAQADGRRSSAAAALAASSARLPPKRLPGVLEPQMDAASALGLTTVVPGEERVLVDDREKQVLGSREVGQGSSAEVIVYTRDVVSGQVERWQPALRFAARSGAHDGFLADYPALSRRFVNPLHVEAWVAVGELGAAYRRLAADPRVASVTLLPVEPPVRLH